ncbi:MAG: DNA repair protein RecN, partial [Acidimicrobiia bacterium]
LGGDRRALARELDLVQFQADEIARAAFVPGEDQELELRANRLRHAEALSIHLGQARSAVGAGQERLGGAVAELRRAGRLDTGLAALAEGAEIEAEALAELARQVRLASEQIRPDPEQLEMVEARLTLLGELRRKYGANLEEVLAFGKAASERSAEITGLLARAETLDAEIASTQRELVEVAQRLTVARRSAGKRLTRAATGHLVDLGFSDPVIRVEVTESDLGPWGGDEVRLLFASDSRLSPGEVARVASGGELSRLVLSLRLASPHKEGASVLIFDEIDSGIGGATALAMGAKLAALAKERQVLCVTHLPQVAAFAGTHFIIEREGAAASVRKVAGSDRIAELSRMLAGLPDSERGREAAGELLELAGK